MQRLGVLMNLVFDADTMSQNRAGRSVVSVKSTNVSKSTDPDRAQNRFRLERWADDSAHAITIFFDCQFYTSTYQYKPTIEFHFYGKANMHEQV